MAQGTVWTAGWNKFGQLGTGQESIFSPLWRQTVENAGAMSAGHLHSLVVKKDGSVWAAGRNAHGQLGDGSRIDRSTFVQSLTSKGQKINAVGVAAGGYHSLVLTRDHCVLATGWNMYGQLGDRFLQLSDKPRKNRYGHAGERVPIMGDRAAFQSVFYGAKGIAAGTRHSLVLAQDGSVWTTGYNQHGELGDGTTITKATFVQVVMIFAIIRFTVVKIVFRREN